MVSVSVLKRSYCNTMLLEEVSWFFCGCYSFNPVLESGHGEGSNHKAQGLGPSIKCLSRYADIDFVISSTSDFIESPSAIKNTPMGALQDSNFLLALDSVSGQRSFLN